MSIARLFNSKLSHKPDSYIYFIDTYCEGITDGNNSANGIVTILGEVNSNFNIYRDAEAYLEDIKRGYFDKILDLNRAIAKYKAMLEHSEGYDKRALVTTIGACEYKRKIYRMAYNSITLKYEDNYSTNMYIEDPVSPSDFRGRISTHKSYHFFCVQPVYKLDNSLGTNHTDAALKIRETLAKHWVP